MGVTLNPIGANGAKIWQDDVYPWKVYGAIGQNVRAWALKPGLPCDDTTLVPTEFVNTVTGTSPVTAGVAQGYPLLLTTGGTEYNGINLQLRGAQAVCAAGKQAFVRAKVKLNEATQSDFLFGLCELKTDLMKVSAAHGVLATAVEGIFFVKVDGSTAIQVKSYKAGTENVSVAAAGTMGVADIDLALWWDGVNVHAYIDNVQVALFAGTLPTAVLTPSFNVRNGASSAVTVSVAELAYVSVE